jgi:hypothetical protein
MFAQYPPSISVRKAQSAQYVPWTTAVCGLLLGSLLTWLLPQVVGLGAAGLWLLGMAIATLGSGLLTMRGSGEAQWGLLLLGQVLGVTAVGLLLVTA